MFGRDIALRGGVAPVRTYIPELLPGILDGRTALKTLVKL
jgi:hypothetical protein